MSKKIKLVSITVVLFSVFLSYVKNKTYEELLEIESCPFCFGTSLCQPFFRNSITVKNSAILLKLLTFLTNILGINNVIFAYFDNQAVVVKKLAHKSEFIEFDDRVKKDDSYSVTENDILMKIRNYLDVPFGNNIMRNIRLCPTVEKFDYLYKFVKNSDNHTEKDDINLWFTISVNPEPLIQKILPQEDGWPVSKYLGSCGRTVVSEYCGEMLTDHIQDMWSTRSSFAHQLLTAAFNLTYSHPLFAFYFTDITPDNIVISSDGKVTFIDLENIIIVERNTTDFLTTWDNVHSSEDIPCENCFAFSSDDICSHSISDHNIYAVCREILSPHSYLIDGGLLHSPPETFLKQNPQFWTVLLHCIQPPVHHSRFYYAKKLLRILK
ncbi:divergent protein kinase domain 2A-like isoform X2 [Lycorma delicatula]|uniref:divergent protein kinase domain 2A-like isoform X2 n=1 Tax=Lycorma delicatula TaxID=130591 RepID=UPI003F5188B0